MSLCDKTEKEIEEIIEGRVEEAVAECNRNTVAEILHMRALIDNLKMQLHIKTQEAGRFYELCNRLDGIRRKHEHRFRQKFLPASA